MRSLLVSAGRCALNIGSSSANDPSGGDPGDGKVTYLNSKRVSSESIPKADTGKPPRSNALGRVLVKFDPSFKRQRASAEAETHKRFVGKKSFEAGAKAARTPSPGKVKFFRALQVIGVVLALFLFLRSCGVI